MFDIKNELKKIPKKPGIYLMKDEMDNIIYVGKANNLRNRVRQYFQDISNKSLKVKTMVSHIRKFEYIVTDNEVEALILENNLIKSNKPRYNILLKDDKTYPYIKVTVNEKYPRVLKTRTIEDDKAKYYGPYTSGLMIKEVIKVIHNIWNIRTCNKKFPRDYLKERPCLNYYIGKCGAPCNKYISEKEYGLIIEEVIKFLNGGYEDLIKKLKREMEELSKKLEFEKASESRDKILSIESLAENQKIDFQSKENQDVIGFARDNNSALVQVFFIRGGKITGREHYTLNGVDYMNNEEIITAFVEQFYSENTFIPKEIILEVEVINKDLISKWLKKLSGSNVRLIVPKKGDKFKLVKFASKNAALTLDQFGEHINREKDKIYKALNDIKKSLGIDFDVRRIEAYDISNIYGCDSVGSMVVFEDGKPKRSDYRKFKIKNIVGANDYGSIEEVISRRFERYKKEKLDFENKGYSEEKFIKLPDIIFVDGGKGQINSVEKVLKDMDIMIPVCGIVKDNNHKTRSLLYKGKEIFFCKSSEAFRFITRVQDEVHRFAIEYHRKIRSDKLTKSILDDIKGIGEKRKKILLKHFGSVENIKKASIKELESVKFIGKNEAESIYKFFNTNSRI